MSSTPLVSICIPCYNKAAYIQRSIESALNQSYENIQIVIYDNGSQDQSRELITRIISKEKNSKNKIKFIYLEYSLNIRDSWHYCLSQADGDFLVILGADDYIDCKYVEKMVFPLIEDPTLDYSVCQGQAVYDGCTDDSLSQENTNKPHQYFQSVNQFNEILLASNQKNHKCSLIVQQGLKGNPFGPIHICLFRRKCLSHNDPSKSCLPRWVFQTHPDWSILIRLHLNYNGSYISQILCYFSYNLTGSFLTKDSYRYCFDQAADALLQLTTLMDPDLLILRDYLTQFHKIQVYGSVTKLLESSISLLDIEHENKSNLAKIRSEYNCFKELGSINYVTFIESDKFSESIDNIDSICSSLLRIIENFNLCQSPSKIIFCFDKNISDDLGNLFIESLISQNQRYEININNIEIFFETLHNYADISLWIPYLYAVIKIEKNWLPSQCLHSISSLPLFQI